jgi:hypothetical protein
MLGSNCTRHKVACLDIWSAKQSHIRGMTSTHMKAAISQHYVTKRSGCTSKEPDNELKSQKSQRPMTQIRYFTMLQFIVSRFRLVCKNLGFQEYWCYTDFSMNLSSFNYQSSSSKINSMINLTGKLPNKQY